MHAHPRGASRRPRRRRALIGPLGIAAGIVVILVAWTGGRSGGSAPIPSAPASGPIGAVADRAVPSAATPATDPASTDPPSPATPSGPVPSATPAGRFPGGLLIADRANARIIVVNGAGRIVWRFPVAHSLPAGWSRVNADDAFLAPDGRTIVANDEIHETIVRIDVATRRVVWTYGHYGRMGSGDGFLHTPDDAYPLANGDIVVADIENCRILEIAPDKSIVRRWGKTGVCRSGAGTFARPNGDTPLPDGGILITEIVGSRVVRLAPDGHVVFDIHVPVAYPSDAQLDPQGNVVVADFSSVGQVVAVNPRNGALVWRWRYLSGTRRLDHPSLATPLPDGTVVVNDDFRNRMIVIDPRRGRIVWQYGRTDVAGRTAGLLSDPDGHQPLPAGGPF